MLLKVTIAEERVASPAVLWLTLCSPLVLCCLLSPSHYSSPLCSPASQCNKPGKMDMSKLPKIRDEERESSFGYVHGVSGPGWLPHTHKQYRRSFCSLASGGLIVYPVCFCSGDRYSHGGSSHVRAGPCRSQWAGGRNHPFRGRHGNYPGLRGDLYPFWCHMNFPCG